MLRKQETVVIQLMDVSLHAFYFLFRKFEKPE